MIEPPEAGRSVDTGALPLRHHRRTVFDTEEGSDQVEIDRRPHLIHVSVDHRAHVHGAARVGEQDVEAAPLRRRHLDCMGNLLLDGHIGHHVTGGASGRAGPSGGGRLLEHGDGRTEPVLGAPADGDMGAVAHQPSGRSQPDPASTSGDQCRPSLDAPALYPAPNRSQLPRCPSVVGRHTRRRGAPAPSPRVGVGAERATECPDMVAC